jgi:uncharacterized membrane protein
MLAALAALLVLAALGYLVGAAKVVQGRSWYGRVLSGMAVPICAVALFYGLRTRGDSQVVLYTAGALLAYGLGALAAWLRFRRAMSHRSTRRSSTSA